MAIQNIPTDCVPTSGPEEDEIEYITITNLIFDQEGFDAEAGKWLGEIVLEGVATMNEASESAWPFDKREAFGNICVDSCGPKR